MKQEITSMISMETIESIAILAKLELSSKEKEQARIDMENMIAYIDKLQELDTTDAEPMTHIFPVQNVFREDVVENDDNREAILRNAPHRSGACFQVPKTIG